MAFGHSKLTDLEKKLLFGVQSKEEYPVNEGSQLRWEKIIYFSAPRNLSLKIVFKI